MVRKVVAFVLCVAVLVMAGAAGAAGFPSTNDLNRNSNAPKRPGQPAPHVNCVDGGPGWIELEFVMPHNFPAVFEVRIDNADPTDEPHWAAVTGKYSSFIPDDEKVYEPYFVVINDVLTKRFEAKGLVQVRHAAGAESDWYFDWVSFEVEPPPHESEPAVILAKHMYSKLFYEILEKLGDYWKAVEEWLRQQ